MDPVFNLSFNMQEITCISCYPACVMHDSLKDILELIGPPMNSFAIHLRPHMFRLHIDLNVLPAIQINTFK